MIRVKIGPSRDAEWLYANGDWKYNVCEDFDENVVILEDRNHYGIEEASWWSTVNNVISELDAHYDDDDVDEYADIVAQNCDISPTEARVCGRLYGACDTSTDDLDFKCELLEVLYPKLNFETATIFGFSQGDWADVIYVADKVNPDILEDWYFGNLVDINVYTVEVDEDGDEYEDLVGGDTLAYTQYQDIDDMTEYVRDIGVVNISPDEEIELEDY